MNKNYKRSEADLIAVPLPEETDSYIPVPNKVVIDTIKERIAKENYQFMGAGYRLANAGKVSAGMLAVKPKGARDLGIVHNISFLNSYDKSRSLRIGSGALVLVCTNGMFTEQLLAEESHIHSGKVLEMIEPMLNKVFTSLDEKFELLMDQVSVLQNTIITMDHMHQIIGQMILNGVLTPLSVNPLISNLSTDPNFQVLGNGGRMTAWNLYNQFTELLKGVIAPRLVPSHVDTHNIVVNRLIDGGVITGNDIELFRPVEKPAEEPEQSAETPEPEPEQRDAQPEASEAPATQPGLGPIVIHHDEEVEDEESITDAVSKAMKVDIDDIAKMPDDVASAVLNPKNVEEEAKF